MIGLGVLLAGIAIMIGLRDVADALARRRWRREHPRIGPR